MRSVKKSSLKKKASQRISPAPSDLLSSINSDYSFGLWIQNRKNAVFGFIKDLNTVVTLRGPGKKANSKKSMLSSQPIGCHGSLPSPFQVMSRGAQGTNHQTNKRETE